MERQYYERTKHINMDTQHGHAKNKSVYDTLNRSNTHTKSKTVFVLGQFSVSYTLSFSQCAQYADGHSGKKNTMNVMNNQTNKVSTSKKKQELSHVCI